MPRSQVSLLIGVQASEGNQHGDFDVSAAVVQPVFRSTPWEEEAREAAAGGTSARILFVSESNVCRSVLAEATMRDLLEAHDMHGVVACESRGSKDYNIGDPPDAMLQQVAAELELRCLCCFAHTLWSGIT
jgi:Low molecular weight phosphotyrosine protein phosphatase